MRAKNILVRPKKGREYLLPKKFTPKIFLGRIWKAERNQTMERRVRWKSLARCEVGENSEMISENYLSLSDYENGDARSWRRLSGIGSGNFCQSDNWHVDSLRLADYDKGRNKIGCMVWIAVLQVADRANIISGCAAFSDNGKCLNRVLVYCEFSLYGLKAVFADKDRTPEQVLNFLSLILRVAVRQRAVISAVKT